MGLFDGGLFDFNGDGKTSPSEGFLGFMLFNEVFGEKLEEPEEFGDEDDDSSQN